MIFINWCKVAYDDDCKARFETCAGDRYKQERVLKDENGVTSLDVVGKSDLYEYIQSHADSVDINKILERYQSGDLTALDRVKAEYMDITDAPKTLAEMYSFVKNASTFFDNLPLEVRKEYDFNPAKFVADIGSEKFVNLFVKKDDKKVKTDDDKKDEVENNA